MLSAPEDFNFFSIASQPYYIFAPDYKDASAGIRALYVLCHTLNCLGYEAYMADSRLTTPQLRAPRLDANTLALHWLSGRIPIALYPEMVEGNPIGIPVVARWLLNQPGHFGGPRDFDADDLLFYYMDWIVSENLRSRAVRLTVPVIDPTVFHNDDNPDDGQRRGVCYYANKYAAFGGKVAPSLIANGTSLGPENVLTRQELAAILRRSEALYCYEQSAIIEESLRCGCPVILVSSSYCDWKTMSGDLLDTPGVALEEQPDHLARAKEQMPKYLRMGKRFHRIYLDMIETFVQRTQAHCEAVSQRDSSTRGAELEKAWAFPHLRSGEMHNLFMSRYGVHSEVFRLVQASLFQTE
ncbi:MAG TPA: hypothetical protein VFW68_10740 [Rhodocyclaceae bacterium]|nr:hypothetical protein [Rhodocyclaceae bacterium]